MPKLFVLLLACGSVNAATILVATSCNAPPAPLTPGSFSSCSSSNPTAEAIAGLNTATGSLIGISATAQSGASILLLSSAYASISLTEIFDLTILGGTGSGILGLQVQRQRLPNTSVFGSVCALNGPCQDTYPFTFGVPQAFVVQMGVTAYASSGTGSGGAAKLFLSGYSNYVLADITDQVPEPGSFGLVCLILPAFLGWNWLKRRNQTVGD